MAKFITGYGIFIGAEISNKIDEDEGFIAVELADGSGIAVIDFDDLEGIEEV